MERVSVRRGNAASKDAGTFSPAVPQHRGSERSLTATVPPIVSDVLRASGEPLDAATRGYMEPRFGHDFSKIRIHPASAQSFAGGNAAGMLQRKCTEPCFGQDFSGVHTGSGKLAIGRPDDQFEKDAERIADDVMHMPAPPTQDSGIDVSTANLTDQSAALLQTKLALGKGSVETASPSAIREASNSPGQSLDSTTREFMEPRFGQDFSHVRVHTDARAAKTAQDIHAHAYTIGSNIVFAPDHFKPHDSQGKRLLAHELAHVMQQTASPHARSGNAQVDSAGGATFRSAPKMISRWVDLGYSSWTSSILGKVMVHHWVGSEAEWREVLKDANNDKTYHTYLKGFLELATNPSLLNATSHPLGFPDFVNAISRLPTRQEILQFMRALYGLASELDLTPMMFTETGLRDIQLKFDISKLIEQYQGDLITEISERDPHKGVVIDSNKFGAVASEGGPGASNSMISSSIHTSVEGVAKLIVARAKDNQSGADKAYSIISNAARVIRTVLDVREAKLAEAKEMNGLVLNVIFSDILKVGKIPAVSALTNRLPAITSHLIKTAHDMTIEAMLSDEPAEQAKNIVLKFTNYVKALGPSGIGALDATSTTLATTSFESAMGKK
jgi:hypothetical protein